ncbi:MAG TPA: TetR/AcrR family transcriptional regulator [Smithellaceae bacterium]|nr:TetR/AcrR family transcriptional regulator [Smithellaceae bacterium]HRS81862.1 TetR/AcrR family transcriptional regulator [Smithellaceae bacterium]HRV44623.1 TetR/AcrR family transcriptional regulator [Smithellaceae bacterium]
MGSKERREREREQRKSLILDTARELLLEKGMKATSIHQIAKRAELSIGAIYFYYKDKEEIFAALQVEGLELLYRTINQAIDKKSTPEKKIRSVAQAYLSFSEDHKSYFDIINYFLTSPGTIFSPVLKKEIDAHGNASISTLAAAIQEGIDKQLFKKVDPRRQAIILWATFNGMIQLKKLEKTILGKNEFRSLYFESLDHFLSGLRP